MPCLKSEEIIVPKALITGVTGQDGSYLAEFLLEKGYEVIGMVRRTSTINFHRVKHIQDKITIVQGDLLDQFSLVHILEEYRPDEVYNLAAQSFVPTSWQQPVFTGEATALGVTRMLDAIRIVDPKIRFYQASSSEMFGKVREVPQRETTPFYPRSPYGVAKVYGHWITINYRESYDLHATSGILFNHECVSEQTPLIIRHDRKIVDVVTPAELVALRRKGRSIQQFEPESLEIWDGQGWTQLNAITATRRRTTDADHELLLIQARAGVATVTAHHHMLNANREVVLARDVTVQAEMALADVLPTPSAWCIVSSEMAEFLGLMAADGYVPQRGTLQFTNNDAAIRARVAELWNRLFLGNSGEYEAPSGWNPNRNVVQLNLTGGRTLCEWLRAQLYTKDGYKRVPQLILNASRDVQCHFLQGYYAGDGLKAGKGDSVKTNSAVLAQGLYWLYANQGRFASVYCEQRGQQLYYQLNLPTANPRGDRGQHLRKNPAQVRRIDTGSLKSEWVFDLETESGVFNAGIGRLIVHNSPRRGLEFVTRKISYHVAKIKLGMTDVLPLGNLDARRDWGFAGDYVRAMWLMLQRDTPDDYVIATGETWSVEQFVHEAFAHVNLDWHDYVTQDPRFMRPAEVDLLVGDPSKAGRDLGWEPMVSFRELVQMMVDADIALLKSGETPM